MKVSTEIDNNFGYEKITQLVDNIRLSITALVMCSVNLMDVIWLIHKVKILGGAILIAKDLPKVSGFTLKYTIPRLLSHPLGLKFCQQT